MTGARGIYPSDGIVLREVGLRDGLQLVKRFPSTAAKRQWICEEHAAGVRYFETGSFLPGAKFPQFADVLEMIATVNELPGAHGMALVLNPKGARNALASSIEELGTVVSATEAHSEANTHRSRAQAVEELRQLCLQRDATEHKPLVSAGIAMAFGCSLTGEVDPGEVVRLAERCLEAGADALGLADSVGFVGPKQVYELTARVVKLAGRAPVLVHLHDTRGMGIANAAAALDAGCRVLDGSLGGLGGCPFAPGATGNIVFEDLVFLCESKGFKTGIDIESLVQVRAILEREMPDEPLHGAIARAGLPRRIAKSAA